MKDYLLSGSENETSKHIVQFKTSDTEVIKGIAIIFMVCNHLFPIQEWIYPENQYLSIAIGSKTVAAYFGGFSKICVALFAFLTGVGMYHTYSKRSVAGETVRKLKTVSPSTQHVVFKKKLNHYMLCHKEQECEFSDSLRGGVLAHFKKAYSFLFDVLAHHFMCIHACYVSYRSAYV